ncbi:Alginate biosynthesis transcriptional activator [Pseudomonas sp. R2-7-07]|nr:Alginate biosynthesis transcriptional activator [Pseudomonas sp. R2-7-07]
MSTNQYDSRTADKFVVRLPDGLRADIEAAANTADRSMNSVFVQAVRQYLDGKNRQALLRCEPGVRRRPDSWLSSKTKHRSAFPHPTSNSLTRTSAICQSHTLMTGPWPHSSVTGSGQARRT